MLQHARLRAVAIVVVIGIGIAAVGCEQQSGGGQGQGPGHRTQYLALTPQQELSLGEQAYREVLSKAHVEHGGPAEERVRQIGGRIAQAADNEPLQREINLHIRGYKFEWEFHVLDDRQVNAFCLPGGKVAVYSGLFQVAKTDDEIAVVLGHEIAHALAHHGSERIHREQMYKEAVAVAGGTLGQLAPGAQRELIGLLAAGAQVGGLAYDRKQESEADHIGLFLMTFAGYDPEQAVPFWEHMREISGQHEHPPTILSDHPSDAQRIAQIKAWVPAAKAAKQAYDHGQIAQPH